MDRVLTDREARLLGVLVEKHLSTPDHYPLSINAATNACNQKSNRNPVVSYSESEVQEAVDSLHRKQLAGRSISSGSRTTKYRHSLGEAWRLQRPELAVLSSLLLRGPQTVGEIRTRTNRMYDFESLEATAVAIESLIEREEPLLVQLPRQPGQKEVRFAHLLCGDPDFLASDGDLADAPTRLKEPGANRSGSGKSDELAELRGRIDALEAAFAAFKKQFE